MAQQKSEDRVVPEGGVMPVERAGSSPGGQGKAVPVEETAVQLGLPIATAENPKGATRRRTRDRLGADPGGSAEGDRQRRGRQRRRRWRRLPSRLTDALLKVASNKGAPGPDGQTIEALLEQWPVVLPEAAGRPAGGDVSARRDPPGVHPQGGRRAARTGNSRRGRQGGPGGRAAGARTAVGADVPSLKPRVPTRPKLPHGDRRGQDASRGRLRVGAWILIWRSSSISSATSG